MNDRDSHERINEIGHVQCATNGGHASTFLQSGKETKEARRCDLETTDRVDMVATILSYLSADAGDTIDEVK